MLTDQVVFSIAESMCVCMYVVQAPSKSVSEQWLKQLADDDFVAVEISPGASMQGVRRFDSRLRDR